MVRRYLALAAVFALALGASRFVPPPMGTVVQNVTAYLSGEGMSSRWHVVTSKVLRGGTTNAYQWYISVYAPGPGDDSKLAFRTPGTNSLLTTLEKANGANMYFPQQAATIVGGAELEQAGVQDVVVATHEAGADCGMATVAILGANRGGAVSVRAKLQNYCDLSAKIVSDGAMQAVQLTGPYYKATSPVCCPAKPKATAMLRYRNGRWVETPMLFKFAR